MCQTSGEHFWTKTRNKNLIFKLLCPFFLPNVKLEEQRGGAAEADFCTKLTRVLLALRAPFGLSFTPQVLSLTEAHLLPIHLYMKAEVEMMHSPLCNDTEQPLFFPFADSTFYMKN